jgi:hypothetical protein
MTAAAEWLTSVLFVGGLNLGAPGGGGDETVGADGKTEKQASAEKSGPYPVSKIGPSFGAHRYQIVTSSERV